MICSLLNDVFISGADTRPEVESQTVAVVNGADLFPQNILEVETSVFALFNGTLPVIDPRLAHESDSLTFSLSNAITSPPQSSMEIETGSFALLNGSLSSASGRGGNEFDTLSFSLLNGSSPSVI